MRGKIIISAIVFLLLLIALTFFICKSYFIRVDKPFSIDKYSFTSISNPYLPLWEHLVDVEPHVFEDPNSPGNYRLYVVGSRDSRLIGYCGLDIHCWSSPIEDLSDWRDEGSLFSFYKNGQWDILFAPDIAEVIDKNGKKTYYLYSHSQNPNRDVIVARGDSPCGPFVPINLSEDGKMTSNIMGYDTSVYVDYITDTKDKDYKKGFRAYAYWGFQRSYVAELDQDNMYSLKAGGKYIKTFIPSSNRYGILNDKLSTVFGYIYPNEDLSWFNYFEAPSIRKVGNKYVFIYSGYSGPEYGMESSNSTLRYAYGDTPLGPWKSGGILIDARGPSLNSEGDGFNPTYSCHNIHGSIEQINGLWYVFYHRSPRGFGYARQSMVAAINVKYDRKLVSEGGKVNITGYDPYSSDNSKIIKTTRGDVYSGAEVSSDGFNIYGLDPYRFYSAGYACYLSNSKSIQDSWDIWSNHMLISNVRNGDIIGYKYFGFGGLNRDTLGLKAFSGSRIGNNSKLDLLICPKTDKSFTINIWLDFPWKNKFSDGKKIGHITIPAGSSSVISKFVIDVADVIDKLDKKHAIYLVAEGNGEYPLFDFIGLGFSSVKKKIVFPFTPKVFIELDGKKLSLPVAPTKSTYETGIMGYDKYDIIVKRGTNKKPIISAHSYSPYVKNKIIHAKTYNDTAFVIFSYNGILKTYRIIFKK